MSLNSLYLLFDRTSLDLSRLFLEDRLVLEPKLLPSGQYYYHRALYLASVIIHNESFGFEKSEAQLVIASLLINMAKVFEDYVRIQLSAKFAEIFPLYQVLNGNTNGINGAKKPLFEEIYTDAARKTIAAPDIVIGYTDSQSASAANPIVLDVKYKEINTIPDRNDINQIITYGISFRSSVVVIVHPKIDSRHGLNVIGKVGDITVYQYIYDLNTSDLDKEEIRFARAMGGLLLASSERVM